MGVSGLWAELEPAHSITTWPQLSDAHFRRSTSTSTSTAEAAAAGGFRVGVDLSLWLFHVEKMDSIGQDEQGNVVNPGRNADLRCIFYRICRLLQRGILAVFVFDGPHKPSWKRGKYVGGSAGGGGRGGAGGTATTDLLKRMFELMGMEWRTAAGEAEAELAQMNRDGEIDAVLSDDVDSFLFGATFVVRNMSKALSANKSKTALRRKATVLLPVSPTTTTNPDLSFSSISTSMASSSFPSSLEDHHLEYSDVPPAFDRSLVTFSYRDILATTGLSREDMILVALMSGGDYSNGIKGCGVPTAKRLAQAGFGRRLLAGIKLHAGDRDAQRAFLEGWREEVAEQLRTNPNQLLEKRNPALAAKLVASSDFPSLEVVNNYANPRVTPVGVRVRPTWDRDVDLGGLIEFVTDLFEWGHDQVRAKLRNNLWVGIVMRRMRRTALVGQNLSRGAEPASALASALVQSVVNLKCEASTDFTPSYSIHLDPAAFDSLIDPFLPRIDPWPFPDYDLYGSDDAERLRAERRRLGRAVERPHPPKTSDYRHWVPSGFVTVDRGCRDLVTEWREGKNRREREKGDKDERKAERARARAQGRSSPVKANKIRNKVSVRVSRTGNPVTDSEGEGSQDERDTATAIERFRQDKVDHSARGLASASHDASSSDVEIIENPRTAARLRPPSKIASVPTSFDSSRSSFGRTKPTLSISESALRKEPTLRTTLSSRSFFASSKPSIAIRPKRSVRAARSSTDGDGDGGGGGGGRGSDSDGPRRHVRKASRGSKGHESPVATKVKARPRVIELSLSSSEDDDDDDADDDGAKRDRDEREAGRERARTRSDAEDDEEDLETFLLRRQQERMRKADATERSRSDTRSRTSAKASRGAGERVEKGQKTELETLVLSD